MRVKLWVIAELAITVLKSLYETGLQDALYEITRRKPILSNRVDPSIEQAVVAMAIDYLGCVVN